MECGYNKARHEQKAFEAWAEGHRGWIHGIWRRKLVHHSCKYRAALLSSLLLLCILLLSSPYVPERFLGIRSPDQVLKSFNTPQNNNNKETEGIMQPNKSKQHSVQKRYVPHKFWARAQPNNKFLKKRRHYKHQPNHPHQVKDIYPLEDWPRVAVEAVNTLHWILIVPVILKVSCQLLVQVYLYSSPSGGVFNFYGIYM